MPKLNRLQPRTIVGSSFERVGIAAANVALSTKAYLRGAVGSLRRRQVADRRRGEKLHPGIISGGERSGAYFSMLIAGHCRAAVDI